MRTFGYDDPRVGGVLSLTQPVVTKPAPAQAIGQTPVDGTAPNANNTPDAVTPNANNVLTLTQREDQLQGAITSAQQGGAIPQGAGSVQAMLTALGVMHSGDTPVSGDATQPAPPGGAPAPATTQPGAPTQFKPNGSSQDNQWADPTLASPLAALTHYLGGISAVGLNGDTGSGGAEGGNGQAPSGELYTTSGYDQNVSNSDSANQSLQAALALAQKYDPSARLDYYDPTGGSEGGSSTPMVRIVMDQSLLPKQPTLPGGVQLLSNVRTANNQTPDAGQGPHLYDQSAVYMDPNWGPYTYRNNINQNYGQNPYTDVGFWGPLAVAAVTGGAGAGLIPGFGGMSTAESLGTLTGALGETGAGASSSVSSILGMSPGKFATAFQGAGRSATQGDYQSIISSLISLAGGLTGIPGAGTIANLGINAARGGGINPLSILGLIRQLGIGGGPNG